MTTVFMNGKSLGEFDLGQYAPTTLVVDIAELPYRLPKGGGRTYLRIEVESAVRNVVAQYGVRAKEPALKRLDRAVVAALKLLHTVVDGE